MALDRKKRFNLDQMAPSPEIYGMLAHFEGFRARAYKDSGEHWTIGYGHLIKMPPERPITMKQALELLQDDTLDAYEGIRHAVKVPLTQHEIDAYTSLTFNIGTGAFASSTIVKELNRERYAIAAAHILDWHYVGPTPDFGLMQRRLAECKLALYDEGPPSYTRRAS